MITNNLLLDKLRDRIQHHNNEVIGKLEKVAMWQNIITICYVVFTVCVFIASEYFLSGKGEIVPGINNKVWSLLLAVILLIPSFPLASKFMGSKGKTIGLDMNDIEPQFDYNGKWYYLTIFKVLSKDDNSKEFKILYENMNNFKEIGSSMWTQKAYELNIEHAYTDELQKSVNAGEDPKVIWQSSPVSFAKNTIEWFFSGTINWKGEDTMANEFTGSETYDVVSSDELGKPSELKGVLKGFVHVGENFYSVVAESRFDRNKERFLEYIKNL